MRITVVIPVYEKPKMAADMIRKILRNRYRDKSVTVIVDGKTSPEIENALSPFKKKIRTVYNRKRYGKSASLNRFALKAKTDVLLFLDNDIMLSPDRDFLTRLAAEMENHELAEIPKEAVQNTLVSKMMGYEFLALAMTSFTIAHISNRCPSMNGAAFAVRKPLFKRLHGFRKVVHEDMDFAARAFRVHARFSYNPALKIRNAVPGNISDWLKQRKRWALNNIAWLRENFFMILTHFFKTPSLFLSALVLMLPFLSYIIVFILMKTLHVTAFLPMIFMTAQQYTMIAGIFLWLSHFSLIFTEGVVPTLIGLFFSGMIYYIFAKILRFRFNIIEFILFYFIYSPIWLLANIIMWVLVILRVKIKLDWKV